MKKTLKRAFAFLLVFAMVLSVTNVFAMITPEAETGVIKEDDYEGTQSIKLGDIVTLEDGNKVVQPKQAQAGWSQATVMAKTDTPVDIVISFDAMAAQTTDAYQLFVRRETKDENSYREYCDFAGIEFSDDGTIRRNADGAGALNNVYDVKLADYIANKWYSIDMVIEGVASTTYQTTVKYYIDGVLVDTLDASAFADSVHPTTNYHYQSDAAITAIFAGSDDTVTDGKMYFDNVKIYKADADEKYYAYSTLGDGKIDIEFSETPAGSMSGAVIKANDGTEVATTVTQQGRKLTATYNSAALKAGEEYALVLPAHKSVTGKELANNAIVFTTAAQDLNEILYIAEHDFEDWTDATGTAIGTSMVTFGDYASIGTDTTHGKTYKMSYLGTGVEADKFIRFYNGANYAYEYSKVSGLNEFIVDLDIKAPELTHVSPEFIVFGPNDAYLGRFMINKNGYFIASSSLNANNNTQLEWDIVDNTKEELDTDKYKAIKVTAGEWYNVKVGIIPATGTLRYYFEDELIHEFVHSKITSDTVVTELRIRANNWAADTVTSVTEIDNVKFGWALGDAKIENATGVTETAKNTKTAVDGGWGCLDAPRVELISNTDAASSEFVDKAAIISADITLDTVTNNVMPAVYNAKGTAIATFWVLNENGDVYVDNCAQNATGTGSGTGTYTFTAGNNGTTITGAFKAGVPTNVTAYVDAARANVYLFLNGTYVHKLSKADLQGVNSLTFDMNSNNTIENYEMIPARIGVRLLQGANNNGNISVTNAKLYSADSEAKHESIRLNSADEEFSIHSSNISNELTSIVVKYTADVTSAPSVSLAKADGTKRVELGTATVSGGTVTIPVNDTIIPNGEYTLTIGSDEYTFTIDNDLQLTISDFAIVDNTGAVATGLDADTAYYATVKVYNPTADGENVTLIIATYENKMLKDVDFVKATVESGGTLSVDTTSAETATLTTTSTTTEVNAFLWSDFKNAKPYKEKIGIEK